MERSYAFVPRSAICGIIGAQTGETGAHDGQTVVVGPFDVYYYHFNDLGAVYATTGAGGSVLGIYEPDHYGNYHNVNVYQTQPDRLGLMERTYDTDAGSYFVHRRWLEPERGRWLSQDPLGLKGGLNPFSYVSNRTIQHVDPSGLQAIQQPNTPGCPTETLCIAACTLACALAQLANYDFDKCMAYLVPACIGRRIPPSMWQRYTAPIEDVRYEDRPQPTPPPSPRRHFPTIDTNTALGVVVGTVIIAGTVYLIVQTGGTILLVAAAA